MIRGLVTGQREMLSRHSLRGAYLLVVALVSASVGCEHEALQPPAAPQAAPPQFVAMLSQGITIQAQDRRWGIGGDDPAPPPFLSSWPPAVPKGASPALLEQSAQFLAAGAQQCWVRVPGREKALYGVLALLPVFVTSPNPSARRTYRVEIPLSNIQQALGGQISVVYEPYPYSYQAIVTDPQTKKEEYADQNGEAASWVLWISDIPFAAGAL